MLPSLLHRPKSWWSIGSFGAMAPAPLSKSATKFIMIPYMKTVSSIDVRHSLAYLTVYKWFWGTYIEQKLCA